MSFINTIGETIGFLLLSLIVIIEGIVKVFIPNKYKMKSVAGEIALVTGGGGGLGRLLSLRLANLGAIVVVWDINKNGIDETVKLVQSSGGTCYGYVCDLCDREDVYKKADQIRRDIGKVGILINNAGVVTGKRFLETPDDVLIKTMDVNILSHFWTIKAFLPAMLEDNKGHIVSVASMAGHVGMSKLVDYCASKFSAVGFAEALRMELAAEGYNINSTTICPYFIRSTGMFEDVQSRGMVFELRFVPTLSANEVADRVITAIRCNEKIVILPSYLRGLLAAKWLLPVTCAEMFLQKLVKDCTPEQENPTSPVTSSEKTNEPSKDQDGVTLHQQLTRRISSSERKP